MLSFHNDPQIKEKYLNRIILHRKADEIIQGIGWENGKGCAVGCTLENYDHSRYPIELGLPEWLARLEDTIFENLPEKDAMLWPERFLSSIPVGVDVEDVKYKIAILRMDRLIAIQNKLLTPENEELNKIILQVISTLNLIKRCHEMELNKLYCDWPAALSAAYSAVRAADSAAWAADSAVWSAVWSARSAAYSAAWAADSAVWSADSEVWAAVWSARSAARSADSAARSADSAARSADSAARSAAWKQEAEDLLKVLSECK